VDNEDNILERLREMLGKNADNISILEHQVDFAVQMEYYDLANGLESPGDMESLPEREQELYDTNIDLEQKKKLLVSIARIEKPEAYRVLQRFLPLAPTELKEWAIMAYQESRILLETHLLDEHKVFISTGLGGKGDRLRYFVVLFPVAEQGFSDTEKKVIGSEMEFMLRRFDGEVEAIRFIDGYATIVALVPLDVPVKQPFQQAVEECNSLKPFIKDEFIITNVKILDSNEIESVLRYRNSAEWMEKGDEEENDDEDEA